MVVSSKQGGGGGDLPLKYHDPYYSDMPNRDPKFTGISYLKPTLGLQGFRV